MQNWLHPALEAGEKRANPLRAVHDVQSEEGSEGGAHQQAEECLCEGSAAGAGLSLRNNTHFPQHQGLESWTEGSIMGSWPQLLGYRWGVRGYREEWEVWHDGWGIRSELLVVRMRGDELGWDLGFYFDNEMEYTGYFVWAKQLSRYAELQTWSVRVQYIWIQHISPALNVQVRVKG